MGQLTATQIINTGLAKAGRTNLTTLAQGWLNSWLSKAYDAWPWPFLTRRRSGLSLAAGASSVEVGAGSGGITARVKRILDPVYVYNTARSQRYQARIRQLVGGSVDGDEDAADSDTFTGIPTLFKVRADSAAWGKWSLIPSPFPDRAYLLSFDYLISPDRITDFGTAPIYPCDETMELAVEAHALRYGKQAEAEAKFQEVAARVMNDRVVYGQVDGTNDRLSLDTTIFR